MTTRSRAAWPNLFVAGAARAGTTSLWLHLGRHPEIWMAPIKEPNFFSGFRPRLSPAVSDEDAYLGLFAPGAGYKLRGEASPLYLAHEGVAAAIKRVSPDARIVISLREPVDRAYSAYWHAVRHGDERRTFGEAVRAELEEPSPPEPLYLPLSFYADSVSRYLDVFPRAVHVLFFEEFAQDPRRELRRIFEFLGVDADVVDHVDGAAHNSFGLPRNRAVASVLNSPRARAAARLAVPLPLRSRLEHLLLRRPPKPPLDAETRERLAAYFAADVARLSRVLGRVPRQWLTE